MTGRFWKTVITVAAVAALAVVQRLSSLAIIGIKPNLLLAFFAAAAVYIDDFFYYLGLLAVGYVFLRAAPGVDWSALTLVVILAAGYWIGRTIPSDPLINLFLVIVAGTAVFYAIVSFPFFISRWSVVAGEALYNMTVGLFWYEVFYAARGRR